MVFENELMSPLKIKVDINESGNIKQTGETAAGTKQLTINGLSSEIDFNAASDVAVSIVGGIFGATFSSDFKQTVDREVAEGTTPKVQIYNYNKITVPTEISEYCSTIEPRLVAIYTIKINSSGSIDLLEYLGLDWEEMGSTANRAYAFDENGFIDDSDKFVAARGGSFIPPQSWIGKKFNLLVVAKNYAQS